MVLKLQIPILVFKLLVCLLELLLSFVPLTPRPLYLVAVKIFSPNIFCNKLVSKVPTCTFLLCFHFIKSSKDLSVFMIASICSFEIINVVVCYAKSKGPSQPIALGPWDPDLSFFFNSLFLLNNLLFFEYFGNKIITK